MTNYEELHRATVEGRDPRAFGVSYVNDGAPSARHVQDYAGVEDPESQQVREDAPLWTHLKWLDSMGNSVRNAFGRTLVGDWDIIENSADGFMHREHTTGKELVNQVVKMAMPEKWEEWRQKRLAEHPTERIQQAATGRDDTNVLGGIGSVLGFGVEVFTDPLTYVAPFMAPIARAASVKRAVRMVGQQRSLAKIAEDTVTRADLTKNLTGSAERLSGTPESLANVGRDVSGITDEFANAGMPVPEGIGSRWGKVAGARAAATADKVESFLAGNQATEGLEFLAGGSRVKYRGETPIGTERAKVKITRDDNGRVVRDRETGLPFTVEDDASKLFIDDLVARTRSADEKTRVAALSQYGELRSAAQRKIAFDEALGDFTSEDVLQWMMIHGVHRGGDDVGEMVIDEISRDIDDVVGPIRAGIQGSDHAELGMAGVMDAWRRYAQRTYEVAELAEPGMGTRIVPFGGVDRDAAIEMSRLQQWLRSEGQSGVGRGYSSGPLNSERYSAIRDQVRAIGVSEKHVDKYTYAMAEANKVADDLMAAMQDVRIVDDLDYSVVTPEMLEVMSAEQTALVASAAKTVHAMDRKLRINALGAETASGPVRTASGDAFGKGFLSADEASDLLARRNALKKSLDEYVMDSQSRMGTAMEKVLGGEKHSWLADMLEGKLARVPDDIASQVGPVRNAAMNAANLAARIGGQAIAATPGAAALGRTVARGIRAPNPFMGDVGVMMGLRDPARVFRGTGIDQILRDAARTQAEARRHYQAKWNSVVKGLEKGDMYALGKALDGQSLDGIPAAQRGRVEAALPAARGVFDELADLAGLPREAQIADYFPHIIDDLNPKAGESLRKGFLAPEQMRSADLLGHMLTKSKVGAKRESPFFKARAGADGEILLNANDVFGVYANSVLKAHYMAPAFRKSRIILTGDELAKPADRARRVIGDEAPTGQVVLPNRSEQMLGYLDDLENVNNGRPIRMTAAIWNQIDEMAEKQGWDALRDLYTQASRISQALTMQLYRSALGFNLPTYSINLTQNIVTAGEWGAMNVLKPFAKTLAGQDPVTMAHILARGDDPSMRNFWSKAFGVQNYDEVETILNERLGLNYHDLVERETSRVSERASRVRDAIHRYDKWAFLGMDISERVNRGVAYNVGVTQALREGLDPISAMKVGVAVSDETQFFYGGLGRGPMFNTPMGRPFLGQFTSYPMKMVGAYNRMLTENPAALMNYIGISGAVAGLISRVGLDPKQVVPFAGLPDRYMLAGGLTPAMGMMAAPMLWMQEIAKESPNEEKIRRYKQDMVMSLPMLTGAPVNITRTGWHSSNVFDGVVMGTNEWAHEIPIIQDLFFTGDKPRILTELEDRGTAYELYLASARMLGFHSEATALASAAVKRLQDIENDSRGEKRYWREVFRDRGGFRNMTDDEYARWRETQLEFRWSSGEVNSLITGLEDFDQTVLEGRYSRASLSSRARFQNQIAGLANEKPELVKAIMGQRDAGE